MRIATVLSLFLYLAVHLLSAQTVTPGILPIAPQQCLWRAGDDPAWAAPDIDESGWLPYSQWKLNPNEPRIWLRCHGDLSFLRPVDQPAIQVSLWAAYELYVDGALTGSAGSVQSGNFSMDTIRSFSLPPAMLHSATIALRMTFRLANKLPFSPLPPLEVAAGDDSVLRGRRAAHLLAQSKPNLGPAVWFSVAGVLGVIAFGFFLYDPSRRELFLLALFSIGTACSNLNYLFAPALVAYSSTVYLAAWIFGVCITVGSRPIFVYALARRRMPLVLWILTALSVVPYIPMSVCIFLPPAPALWLHIFSLRYLEFPHYLVRTATATAPFFAFWPYSRITRRMRPLAGLCLIWGASVVLRNAALATGTGIILGIPDLYSRWGSAVAMTQALIECCVMVALFALLFREQRQIALDRAVLAGEMQAASEIQRMLAPANLDCAPGLHIDVAFHPMREVGGDFYLCRVLPDGSQRILTGDVSGKGAAAAMAATLSLGAAAVRDADQPGILLENLNRLLLENNLAGFATCLCADIAAGGEAVIANAGHLPPYLAGTELSVDGGLPLGLASGSMYSESRFQIEPDQQLTILTDGVVEARNTGGELFGFDRARAISVQSAEQIASAAQSHGQEDDITVLTLTFLPVGVAHV
jgi:hypothetical protein